MSKIVVIAFALVALAGCTLSRSYQVYNPAAVDGPREIALSGARQPWTGEIESRLREKGYTIKRFTSTTRRTNTVSPGNTEAYNEASVRLILSLDGYAPNSPMLRCVGGGYKFDYITAEVIDTQTNETLAAYSNAGYSENCPPLSQGIFADIVSMLDAVYKK